MKSRWLATSRVILAALALFALSVPAHAAKQIVDGACETSTTSGTGTLDLGGALSGGYISFAAAGVTSGNTVPYQLRNGKQREGGWGVFTAASPDTLTRVADWSTDGAGAELTLSGRSTICIGNVASMWNSPQLFGDLDTKGFDILYGSTALLRPLTINTTFYIRTGGTDDASHDGLTDTDGEAWATFAYAFNRIVSTYNSNGHVVTIQFQKAAWTEPIEISLPVVGPAAGASLILDFGGGSLTTTDANAIVLASWAPISVKVQNVTLSSPSSGYSTVLVFTYNIVWIGKNVVFGDSGRAHIEGQDFTTLYAFDDYEIAGDATEHILAGQHTFALIDSSNVTLTGTPAFGNAYARAYSGAHIRTGKTTFTGSATGVRFIAETGGEFYTANAGLTYFPGNSAGIARTLGTYDGFTGTISLFEGAVINWDSGDATLTQTGNDLSFAGISTFGFGTSTAVTLGTMELGAASDTTLSRAGAGAIQVEGVEVVLNATSPTLGTLTTTGSIELGNPSDTTVARSSAGNVSIEGSVVRKAGTHTIWLPASAMLTRATSGADCLSNYDSGSNDVSIRVCAFDTTTQEYAHFQIAMPKSWNEGTITFRPHWTNTGGSSTQTVALTLACVAISNDDTLNASIGAAQSSSGTWLAQNDNHVGPTSSAITCDGTPAEADLIAFQVSRDVGSDNMSGDALLIGLEIFYTTDAANDG